MEDDFRLVQRVIKGVNGADEELVASLYRPIFLALRHLTRSREDAEDLTQQTFILVKQNIRQFRGKSSLKTWALRIGYREYLRMRKQTDLRLAREEGREDPQVRELETAAWSLDLLATLPPKQRETFVLLEIEGLAVREVARIMAVPAGTVKTRHFHARRTLKKKIEQEEQLISNVVQIHES